MMARTPSWKVLAPSAAVLVGVGAGGYWVWDDTTAAANPGRVLDCGTFTFPACDGPADQFDEVFVEEAGDDLPAAGGFGGGGCEATHTPVVFVHGNADRAINWDSEITGPVADLPVAPASVYDTFAGAGYQGCELYGLSYLTDREQDEPGDNYHSPAKYRQIIEFIDDAKEASGQDQVDIVSHSLGVSMTMAALTWHDETYPSEPSAWGDVRRFVNVAGGLHGLDACRITGPANPIAKTCGSQNVFDKWTFGFYPDAGPGLGSNAWTAASGEYSLRQMPARHPDVAFYTISAGENDEVHCGSVQIRSGCASGPLFDAAPNVRSQLDVGAGAVATDLDYDGADGNFYTVAGGDLDGVGHFKAKNNTGQIILTMLTSDCEGLTCQGDYVAGPVEAAA